MAMKTIPEQRLTSSDGRKERRVPPRRALIPSTTKKASILPRKTCLGEDLRERAIVAIWVLSPSSAKRIKLKAVKIGVKSNPLSLLKP
ncbi:MAG: hypothetical protein QXO94_03415 [Candidatus Bathyarchaeia archaeon]